MPTAIGTIKSVAATKYGSAINLVEEQDGFFSKDPISANTFSVGDKVEISFTLSEKGNKNFYFRQVKLVEKGNGAVSSVQAGSTMSSEKGDQIRRQGLLQAVVSGMTIVDIRTRTQDIADTVALLETFVLTGKFGPDTVLPTTDFNTLTQAEANPFAA